jgi:hypothetical protein
MKLLTVLLQALTSIAALAQGNQVFAQKNTTQTAGSSVNSRRSAGSSLTVPGPTPALITRPPITRSRTARFMVC